MTEFFSALFHAEREIAGHPIAWRETVGNLFGLAAAIGGLRRRVWAWPVGIVGAPLLWHSGFYPSAVLYAIYGGVVMVGFVVWRRASRAEATP